MKGMENIELAIKIPKAYYDMVIERCKDPVLLNAFKNGTVLPKGHGRLIDGSKLKVELECGVRAGNYEKGYEKYTHINSVDDCIDAIEYADTILEADRSEEE